MKQYAFSDAQFMSARERALVQKAWVRFLKNGLREEDFSDRLYKHLINHCSFIAHYNRAGFYATYFENGEDTTRFLSQFDKRGECRSVEYGGSWWIGGDYSHDRGSFPVYTHSFGPSLRQSQGGRSRRGSETGGKTRLRDPARMKLPDVSPACATNQFSGRVETELAFLRALNEDDIIHTYTPKAKLGRPELTHNAPTINIPFYSLEQLTIGVRAA